MLPAAGSDMFNLQVPLFKEDEAMGVPSLLAKWAHFGTGGWWVGGTHMIANQSFIQEVRGLRQGHRKDQSCNQE